MKKSGKLKADSSGANRTVSADGLARSPTKHRGEKTLAIRAVPLGDRRGAGSKRNAERRVYRRGAEVGEGRGGIRSPAFIQPITFFICVHLRSSAVEESYFWSEGFTERFCQAALVPAGVALRAEEDGALIVVHAMDFPAELCKVNTNFGANESG